MNDNYFVMVTIDGSNRLHAEEYFQMVTSFFESYKDARNEANRYIDDMVRIKELCEKISFEVSIHRSLLATNNIEAERPLFEYRYKFDKNKGIDEETVSDIEKPEPKPEEPPPNVKKECATCAGVFDNFTPDSLCSTCYGYTNWRR